MHNRWAFTNATNDNALSVMARQVELLSDKINQLHSEKTAEIKHASDLATSLFGCASEVDTGAVATTEWGGLHSVAKQWRV